MKKFQFRPTALLRWLLSGLTSAGLVALAVNSAGVCRADDSGPYQVQIVQPFKVGDRVHLQREIEETITATTTGGKTPQPAQSAGMQLKFAGTLEALEVDSSGQPSRWKVIAETASVHRGPKGHEELVKPGTEFTAQWNGGKVSISPSGNKTLSDDATKLLPILFEAAGGSGESSLDAILKSTAPQAVGSSWKIDAKAAVEELKEFDRNLKPADVSGTVRLNGAAGSGDKKALTIEYQFKARSKNPANPPAGMTPVGAERDESGSLTIPADLSTGYFSAKATIRVGSQFKKSDTQNVPTPTKSGNTTKTVNKSVKVELDTTVNRLVKISTQLVYERFGGVDRKTTVGTQ